MTDTALPIQRAAFMRSGRLAALMSLLAVLTLAAFFFSLSVGAVKVPFPVILNTLFDLGEPQQTYIIMKSRLPRTLLALLTGASLAVAGALIQAVIRNPLASPKIVGINSGAALVACGLTAYFSHVPASLLPLAAGLGGVAAASVILVVSYVKALSARHLALVGIAVGFLCEAGVDYILVTTTTREMTAPMVWLTGSLWGRTWAHLEVVWPPLMLLMGAAFLLNHLLDIFGLGEDAATGLGLNAKLLRLTALLVATLLASVSVSVVGVMGFVGLMAPHMARMLAGGRHRTLLPLSALIGAFLVTLADGLGRAIAPPVEISAGILTAVIGAPFFIYLMTKVGEE